MSDWKADLDPEARGGRYLAWKEVARATGLSRTTAWRLQKRGEFPAPYVISPGRVGYRDDEVEAWRMSRGRSAARAGPASATPRPRPRDGFCGSVGAAGRGGRDAAPTPPPARIAGGWRAVLARFDRTGAARPNVPPPPAVGAGDHRADLVRLLGRRASAWTPSAEGASIAGIPAPRPCRCGVQEQAFHGPITPGPPDDVGDPPDAPIRLLLDRRGR